MLLELYIKNFALIDEMRIEYEQGLNIITGETGSGKSIMIDALALVLGRKGSKSYVRTGQKKATIEANFYVSNKEIIFFLEELGIEVENDQLTISREIFEDGRSVSRVNGRTISQSDLKVITSQIITIHGQNEYEQLLTSSNQLRLIDNFGGSDIQKSFDVYKKNFEKLLFIQQEILLLNENMDSSKIERELDLLSYEIEEILEANIKQGEKEDIKEQLLRLEHSEKIRETLDFIYESLYGDNNSVLGNLSKCITKLSGLSDYFNQSVSWLEAMNTSYYLLEDVVHELKSENYDRNDIKDIDDLNTRLDRINQIFRKYGKNYEEVMIYLQSAIDRKERIISRDKLNQQYTQELEKIQYELVQMAKELSSLRKKAASKLKEEIQIELESLNMTNVQFEIAFNKRDFGKTGIDQVDFLISFNKGEALKPFSQVASGGEISRFMLAFKTVVAKWDNIHTLIFDEIDTGVSGLAAQKIGMKLKEIGNFRQVLCITHLPQIASFADVHFVVEKFQVNDHTETKINKLDFENRVHEIAKMMSGSDITESTLKTSKDLIIKNSEKV